MKTKLEIIEETCNYYNSNNRGVDYGGSCVYYSDGKMCAVGRCLCNPKEATGYGSISSVFYGLLSQFDNIFKEEYRGHRVEFWQELQHLHDCLIHWNEIGLSERGLQTKNSLIKKWCLNEN